MKNVLRLSMVTALFTLTFSSANAQEVIQAPAPVNDTPAVVQDTMKKSSAAPAPSKTEVAPKGSKSEEAAPGGGTRMAINEQGVPTKGKKKKAAAKGAPTTTTPAKKDN